MGSLGWPEILIILVIALIIFGPRKLPELGKSLGNSLAQFRRASEDFKRTWEEEVEVEKRRLEIPSPAAAAYSGETSETYGSDDFRLEGHTTSSDQTSPGDESVAETNESSESSSDDAGQQTVARESQA
jgi:TatA/E family protein of Tat protein translocase